MPLEALIGIVLGSNLLTGVVTAIATVRTKRAEVTVRAEEVKVTQEAALRETLQEMLREEREGRASAIERVQAVESELWDLRVQHAECRGVKRDLDDLRAQVEAHFRICPLVDSPPQSG